MAKSFVITTTATEVLRADSKSHAEAGFTVTNTTSRAVRGLARVRPLGDTKQQWLNLQGEAERDFAPGATQQFTVSFDGPRLEPAPATAAGTSAPPPGALPAPGARKYPFRLDVESALNPDEDFTEGPTVTVEMVPPTVAPKAKFPKWIIFVILGVVLLIGIIVLILILKNDDTTDGNQSPTPTPAATATPTPTPAQAEIEQACFDLVQNKIEWNYVGSKTWDPPNIQNLCRGTTKSTEPPDCFQRVMHTGINWGGGIQWDWTEASALCAGTDDANATISCFKARIAQKVPKQAAIGECKKVFMAPPPQK